MCEVDLKWISSIIGYFNSQSYFIDPVAVPCDLFGKWMQILYHQGKVSVSVSMQIWEKYGQLWLDIFCKGCRGFKAKEKGNTT